MADGMSKLRLDKYLADMGVGTRQEVKGLIRKGRVAVDGTTAKAPELKVDPDEAQVTVDGNSVSYVKMEYWMLHKPAGVVSATEDRRDRTVLDLLSDAARKDLFPVGRLDKDTEGLLLITNDGALSHRLLSPKSHVSKVYEAVIDGKVTEEDQKAFAEGLDIGDDKPTLPAELVILETTEKEPGVFESRIQITICEGRFHQIKRMFEKVGKKVVYLKRRSMGSLELDPALPKGSARPLTQEEKAAFGSADAAEQKGK